MRKIEVVAALTLGTMVAVGSSPARAHFVLQTPANWARQNNLGDPQKSAPCGQADPGSAAMPTNTVTPYAPGQRITVTINETIMHPGHYRVALSTIGQNGLPADPLVTEGGGSQCGSTVIGSAGLSGARRRCREAHGRSRGRKAVRGHGAERRDLHRLRAPGD